MDNSAFQPAGDLLDHPSGLGSSTPAGEIQPFRTIPDNSTSTSSEPSFDAPLPSTNSSPQQSPVASTSPTESPGHGNAETPQNNASNSSSVITPQIAPIPSPPSPSSNQTPKVTSEDTPNTSVTVQAVPAQTSKNHSNSDKNIPPPSRGALIALATLTVFFVLLTVVLLLWRRRRQRSSRKKTASKMEEVYISPGRRGSPPASILSTKGISGKFSSASYPGNREMHNSYPFIHQGVVNPFPPGPSHSKGSHKLQGEESSFDATCQYHSNRQDSWRSSIATAWAKLGLPSRMLNDPAPRLSDDVSSKSHISSQSLVNSLSQVPSELVAKSQNHHEEASVETPSTKVGDWPFLSGNLKMNVGGHQGNLGFKQFGYPQSDSNSFFIDEKHLTSKSLASRQSRKTDSISTCESESQLSPTITGEALTESPKASFHRSMSEHSIVSKFPIPSSQRLAHMSALAKPRPVFVQ